ncbi:MAG: tetratricopeptide repeat protein [Vicinamibacteria bacterium]|nr:tetratricopeptide repeat protein [Vicinamibacteria bacterium]
MMRLVWVAVLALASARAAQVDDGPARYLGALRAYASGEREAAVARVGPLAWEEMDAAFGRFRSEVNRAGRCRTCPDTLANEPIRAAAMLHLDRDLVENPPHQDVEQPPPCGGRHARRALEYAELLALRERTREFARRFYVAMTWRAEWDACLFQAVGWARTGLVAFPDDPDLLLALGVTHEKAARLGGKDPGRLLREARRHLARVVAVDPGRLSARVHLGRVLWRLGQLDEARRTLEAAVEVGGGGEGLYLAHVFLGHVHGRAGRPAAAADAFRRALAIAADGPVATIGLAHALRQQGDLDGAARIVDRALGSETARFDPYRDYNADNARDVARLFDALREEARQ